MSPEDWKKRQHWWHTSNVCPPTVYVYSRFENEQQIDDPLTIVVREGLSAKLKLEWLGKKYTAVKEKISKF